MRWRSMGCLMLLCGLGGPAAAVEWDLVAKYDSVAGRLGDLQPEAASYGNTEFYDQGTQRFYSAWNMVLTAGQTVVIEAYSLDFQPSLLLRDGQNAILVDGTKGKAAYVPDQGRNSYVSRIEFAVAAGVAGPAELLVTTAESDLQGNFTILWSAWTPKPEAGSEPGPTPEPLPQPQPEPQVDGTGGGTTTE